jgi:hypothetical protein
MTVTRGKNESWGQTLLLPPSASTMASLHAGRESMDVLLEISTVLNMEMLSICV